MDFPRQRSAGLDVHRSVIVACALLSTPGNQVTKEVKHCTATAAGLAELEAWLIGYGATHVGIGAPVSTGCRCMRRWKL